MKPNLVHKALFTGAFFIFITFLLGGILRFSNVTGLININYKYFTHAHSHVGFLGGVYFIITGFLLKHFIKECDYKKFETNFYITLISVIVMLISFPAQGYKAISIGASTLHIFCALYFIRKFITNNNTPNSTVKNVLYYAFFFNIISVAGPLSLPVIIKTYGHNSPTYFNAIYFYLHNQYNGWFLFALTGILIKIKNSEINIYNNQIHFLAIAQILLVFQNFLWTNSSNYLVITSLTGAIIQFGVLASIILQNRSILYNCSLLLKIGLYVILIKSFIQLFACIPEIMNYAYLSRHLIIAYLHLYFLGFIIPLFYYILNQTFNYRIINKKTGYLYFGGLSIMILTLLIQATGLITNKLFYMPLFISALLIITDTLLCIKTILKFLKSSLKES